MGLRQRVRSAWEILCRFLQIVHGFSTVIWGLFSPFFWLNMWCHVRWYLISCDPLNDSRCQHNKEVNEAVEAGLYNNFTRYGKMTMHLLLSQWGIYLKQGSDETLFCIAFARFVSGFQLRAYLIHAVCLIFVMQTIDNILNNWGKESFISFWWYTWRHLYLDLLFTCFMLDTYYRRSVRQ
jgi:hypothetical protein